MRSLKSYARLLPAMLIACSSGSGGTTQPLAGSPAAAIVDSGAPASAQDLVVMSDVDVPANSELYKCQDFVNPFGKDIAILSSESVISVGSHHFAAFRMAGLKTAAITDCPNGGLEAHEFVHASQQRDQVTTYPPGVGRFLPATDGLRIMVHYLNTTGQPIHAAGATFSMRYVDADQIHYKAAGVFLNNVGLSVPPGQSMTTRSFALKSDIKLLVAVSHMHAHALDFTSSTSDGRKVYESTQWSEPTAAEFDPPMEIGKGTSITWSCSFDNQTGQTLTFGQSATQNEMCIFNGVYYPSADGTSIVENIP